MKHEGQAMRNAKLLEQRTLDAVPAILEMEMEMDERVQPGKHERTTDRAGSLGGYYRRRLTTRVGTTVPGAPQDRAGHLSTQVCEQYLRRRA
jgi:transposase-like protein